MEVDDPILVVADGREDAEGVEQVLGRCVEQLSAFAQLFLESPLVGDVLQDDDGLQDRSPEVEDRVRVEGNEDVVALPVGDGELHRLRLAADGGIEQRLELHALQHSRER